jgi:hypothetical protein
MRNLLISLLILTGSMLSAQPWQQNDALFNPSGIPSLPFSQPRFADLDGDGDFDMIIGNLNGAPFCMMNTGSRTYPKFTVNDTLLSNVASLDAEMAVFHDMDNDGDLDMLCGGYNGLTLYTNEGTSEHPAFPAGIPFAENVECGMNPIPDFADLDADGDLDMVLGFSESGAVKIFVNIGTPEIPQFSDAQSSQLVDVGLYAYPTFGDLDNDGDTDLLIGKDGHGFSYYENTGDSSSAVWQGNSGLFSGLGNDDYWNSPDLVDLTGNGKLDLVFGTASGPISFYRNTGTPEAPAWTVNTSIFGGVMDVGGASSPFFFDFDDDGDLDMICGTQMGDIKYFENTGTVSVPTWKENSSRFTSLKHSIYAAVTLGDVNGDSLADAIVGDLSGKLYLHLNTGTSFSANNAYLGDIALGGWSVPRLLDFDGDGDLDLAAGNENGNILYFENQGDAQTPNWVEIPDFFGGIDVGSSCVPSFADLDFDGDFDMITGDLFREIQYFENRDGAWIEDTLMVSGLTVGQNAAPALADLDGDGDFDLTVGNYDGTFNYFINLSNPNSISQPEIPVDFKLFSAFPNPFNATTKIKFELSQSAPVKLAIFNIQGQQVWSKKRSFMPAGTHTISWNAQNQPSGVYLIQLSSGFQSQTTKAILLK